MLNISGTEKVYFPFGSTDMRRYIDGLAAITQLYFSLDPFPSDFFVFCNKNRTMIKYYIAITTDSGSSSADFKRERLIGLTTFQRIPARISVLLSPAKPIIPRF